MKRIKNYLILFFITVFLSSTGFAKDYTMYIRGEMDVGSTKHIRYILNISNKDDVVYILINSPGGNVKELSDLLESIGSSKSKVVTVAANMAASAAGIVLFAGDEVRIGDQLFFLAHLPTRYRGDTKIPTPIDHPVKQWVVSAMDYFYGRYLTNAEVYYMLQGKDVVIPGFELKRRVEACKVKVCKSTLLIEYAKLIAEKEEGVI